MSYRKVKQGECISSICYETGHSIETVWNHPNNKELIKKRKNLEILYPGDELFIPDTTGSVFECKSGQKHVLQLHQNQTILKLKLENEDGSPQANIFYILQIDNDRINGTTNEFGEIIQTIESNIKEAKLTIDDDEYTLNVGYLDPIDEITGIQCRLANLGFYQDEISEQNNQNIEEAIKSFQRFYGINETGKADLDTLVLLEYIHGS